MIDIDREYRAIVGIGGVMVGVGQAAVAFVDIAPEMTGGLLAVLGGIYIVEQVDGARADAEAQ